MAHGLIALVVYTYSSFTSSWGPGPSIADEFKRETGATIKFVDVGDGGSLITRLKLEGEKTPADVVLGIDENTLVQFTDLGWKTNPILFDYGPYAFVYNSKEVKDPPHSLDDLLSPRFKGKIILEDPRLSTVGLGFLLWVISQKGENGAWDYFRSLKKQIKITSPSWDLAYGVFKNSPENIVFSYWTSPVYHIQEEERHDIKAAAFEGGNYVQREFALANPHSSDKDLQKKFLQFLLQDFAQQQIAKKNFMFPANAKTVLPQAYKEIGRVKEIPPLKVDLKKLEAWLSKWREIFS
jgi:thiamine transport system substrate-binding protein